MAIKLSEVAEGSILLLNENGSLVEFYVAKHDYEAGLNGSGRTLVVRKDCYDTRAWHSSNVNAYASSAIDTWLNSTYKGLLDADIQSVIGTTNFYYTPGNGSTSVTTLTRAIFLLSVTELGKTASYANTEGSALPIASTLQIAYRNGSAVVQWTRSPSTNNTYDAYYLGAGGVANSGGCTVTRGSRPAFTLPGEQSVTENDSGKYELATLSAPEINAPSSLGIKRGAFSFTYTLIDGSGDCDLVESVSGIQIASKTGVSGGEIECVVGQSVFDQLEDGSHVITITATNAAGSASTEVGFRKVAGLLSFDEYISENAALRQTLADTLTEKGVEASGKEGYATLVEKVGAIEAGAKLPTLSNPASPAEILSGYEAINDAGEVVTGTALATATTATAAQILSGKTAYNSAGELLTGTAVKGLTKTIKTVTAASGKSATLTIGAHSFFVAHMLTSPGGVEACTFWNGSKFIGTTSFKVSRPSSTTVKFTNPNWGDGSSCTMTVYVFS